MKVYGLEFPGYGAAVRLIGMSLKYDGYPVIGAFNWIGVVDRLFTQRPIVYNIEPGQWKWRAWIGTRARLCIARA